MRRTIVAAAVALGMTLVGVAPSQAVDDVNTKKLRQAVSVAGILKHERAFQSIANANDGTRASGLPGFEASKDYVVQQLRRAGYTVDVQEFTFPFYRDLAAPTVSQLTPDQTDYETATLQYSGSGDVSGPVVPASNTVIPPTPEPSSTSGCAPADFPANPAANSIALIQRGTCNFEDKARNAKAAGYAAVVIFNEGNPDRTDLFAGALTTPGADLEPIGIPVVALSYADGAALYQAAAAGGATARVTTSTEVDGDRTTYNVLASTPKGKQPGRVVVGAHLDSVVAGPGINDNGSGAATILETAVQMSKLGYNKRLQHQVTFAFWGAEELGLLGSQHYVDNLTQDQKSKIYANLNFDMLGSPNYVRFVYDGDGSAGGAAGPPGSAEIEGIFTDYFDDAGLASAPTAFDGRSDYGPFIAEGIPAGGLFSGAEDLKTAEEAQVYGGTAGKAYDSCYHLACDDITNLNSQALFELGDAAAHATLTLALSKTGLFPDGSSGAYSMNKVAAAQSDYRGPWAVR